jgi:hypothetical protein
MELESLEQKIGSVLADMQVLKDENCLMFNDKKHLESVRMTLGEGLDKYRVKYREKKIECKTYKTRSLKVNIFLQLGWSEKICR